MHAAQRVPAERQCREVAQLQHTWNCPHHHISSLAAKTAALQPTFAARMPSGPQARRGWLPLAVLFTLTMAHVAQAAKAAASPSASADEASMVADNRYQSTAMLISVTFLIVMTCVFETGKERILESMEGSRIITMIQTMFSELTVLGFLMFIAYVLEQSGVMIHVSLWLWYTPRGSPDYGENTDKFGELFEASTLA